MVFSRMWYQWDGNVGMRSIGIGLRGGIGGDWGHTGATIKIVFLEDIIAMTSSQTISLRLVNLQRFGVRTLTFDAIHSWVIPLVQDPPPPPFPSTFHRLR